MTCCRSAGCERSTVVTLRSWKTDRAWHQQPLRLPAAGSRKPLVVIPDGSFQLALPDGSVHPFFVEMDMATERVVSYVLRDGRMTLHYKLSQYDRYLKSMRYSQTLHCQTFLPVHTSSAR